MIRVDAERQPRLFSADGPHRARCIA
jgi:hypothetical protein